jgi:3-methyladenine DNA glycosylase/8-oxoguanine DNA glycosylase
LKPTPAQLRALARRDPALGRALERVAPFPGFPAGAARVVRTHFHSLARSIIYQQLAGKAAQTIHDRVAALGARKPFPTAAELLEIPEERLRGAGLSRNKLAALRDLAEHVESGRLRLAAIGRMGDEAIVERLIEVRGVGRWTAEMFLMFRLGRLDVMPATDLGVREGLRRLDALAERPLPAEVLERAEAWRPLCSVASWVLWRLAEEKPS